MGRIRLALLNASRNDADTRRNFRRELAADLVEYDVTEHELPETDSFDGCVLTGSWASVYWDDPWIGELESWVSGAVDRGLPFLGVCYGHQLLADVLGGRIEDMGEYEIGYRTIRRTGESRLLDGIDREFTAFTTHSDRVVRLPPGGELLAENDYGIQGFRCDTVFTVQFHPEYDRQTARRVTKGKETLAPERVEAVLDDVTPEQYAAACETKVLFENFLEFVREEQASDRTPEITED